MLLICYINFKLESISYIEGLESDYYREGWGKGVSFLVSFSQEYQVNY